MNLADHDVILNELDYFFDTSDPVALKYFISNFLMKHKDDSIAFNAAINKFPQYKDIADKILLLK